MQDCDTYFKIYIYISTLVACLMGAPLIIFSCNLFISNKNTHFETDFNFQVCTVPLVEQRYQSPEDKKKVGGDDENFLYFSLNYYGYGFDSFHVRSARVFDEIHEQVSSLFLCWVASY